MKGLAERSKRVLRPSGRTRRHARGGRPGPETLQQRVSGPDSVSAATTAARSSTTTRGASTRAWRSRLAATCVHNVLRALQAQTPLAHWHAPLPVPVARRRARASAGLAKPEISRALHRPTPRTTFASAGRAAIRSSVRQNVSPVVCAACAALPGAGDARLSRLAAAGSRRGLH